ncbi:MAG: SDR family oxidoreductase [Oscillospiraceae bacterium]|nr:SDR family oxidoreductase [Oscillospiraceae bacterium]
MVTLKGQNAIVTGAARGLGREYALRLASLGANVGVIDIDLKSFEEFEAEKKLLTADTVTDEISALGVRSAGAVADIGNREQVYAAVEDISEKLGDISILICNAGGGMGPMDGNKASQMNWEQFHAVTARNYFGTVYTCNAVAPMMKKNGYGKIVNVASVGGLTAGSDGSYAHYAAAKAAVIHYTKLLAQELGPYNITCNVIAPGFISTARLVEGYKTAGEEKFTRNIAMGRFGTPEDCAKAVEFLTTDMSSYVSGAVLEVTGGTVGRILMNLEY